MPDRVFASRPRIVLAACIAVLLAVSLSGCQTLSYYSQAVSGQIGVWRAAEPIDELLRDEETSPALRQRLELGAQAGGGGDVRCGRAGP